MKTYLKKPQESNKKNLFLLLPKKAEAIVKSDPKKQKQVETVVKKIFKKYGEDISALARY